MSFKLFFVPVFALIVTASSVFGATVSSVIDKYGEDLAEIWTAFPSEKQAAARQLRVADLDKDFSKDLKGAEVQPEMTVGRAVTLYIDRMVKAKSKFRIEKMKPEQGKFMTGVTAAFKIEFTKSSDFGEKRSAEQLMNLEMKLLEEARDGLRLAPETASSSVYSAIDTAINPMYRKAATGEEAEKRAELLDKTIKEINKRFPKGSAELEKRNAQINSIMDKNARAVFKK